MPEGSLNYFLRLLAYVNPLNVNPLKTIICQPFEDYQCNCVLPV